MSIHLSHAKQAAAASVGVRMTGLQIDLANEEGHAFLASFAEGRVDWADKRLARITRLRLLSDPGFPVWDVSYCWGVLHDGTNVRVSVPFDQLPKRQMIRAIITYAKQDGVYAKGLGILDVISTLQ